MSRKYTIHKTKNKRNAFKHPDPYKKKWVSCDNVVMHKNIEINILCRHHHNIFMQFFFPSCHTLHIKLPTHNGNSIFRTQRTQFEVPVRLFYHDHQFVAERVHLTTPVIGDMWVSFLTTAYERGRMLGIDIADTNQHRNIGVYIQIFLCKLQ